MIDQTSDFKNSIPVSDLPAMIMAVDRTHSEGREQQYKEMMQALEALERKYKGVRGALLKKVRSEFEHLSPQAGFDRGPQTCSACGRELKPTADGGMRCMNGHSR